MILRPHQETGVADIRAAFARGAKRVLYQAPTGSGKTVLFTYIVQNAAARGNKVCILVHRRELLNQASRTLLDFGVEHGLIMPGSCPTGHHVYVASKDTLNRRDGYQWDLLVIDEAHHATATTYRRLIESAPWVLGVTATPCRLTGNGLGTIFESLVMGPTVDELTPQFLAPYKYYAPPCKADFKRIKSVGGDYVRDELAAVMDTAAITGDIVKHYAKYLNGKPSLGFAVNVEHAYHMRDIFQANGYRAEAVDGKLDSATRDTHVRNFTEGRINMLLSCDLFNEGLDVPGAHGAVLTRLTKSLVICMQQWGRVLRACDGKDAAVFMDHVGNCFRHGMPNDNREWSLTDGAVKPEKAKQEEQIRQCPSCYYVHDPSPRCPNCGHEYAVKERKGPRYKDGDLVEIEAFSAEEKQAMIRNARSLEDLHQVGKRLGYKPGWAFRVHTNRRIA